MSAVRLLLTASAALTPVSFADSPGIRAVAVLVIVLAVAAAMLFGAIREPRHYVVWAFGALLVFVAAVLVAGSAIDPGASTTLGSRLAIAWILLPLVACHAMRNSREISRLSTAFVVGQSVSALIGIITSVTGGSVMGAAMTQGRAEGLAGHPNILGLMASVAALLSVQRAVEGSGVARAAFAVNVLAVLLSGSISSLGALVVGGAVLVASHPTRGRLLWKVVVPGALALVAALYISTRFGFTLSPLERVRRTSGQTVYVSTLDERAMTWRFALDRIARDPFRGVGLDDSSGQTDDGATLVHNILLRSWLQGGIVLVLAVGGVLLSGLAAIGRSLRRSQGGSAAAILATVIAFSLTSASFFQLYFWIVYVAAWVVLVGPSSSSRIGGDPRQQHPTRGSLQHVGTSDQECD